MPTRVSSSTTYCTTGLRPTGSISFGCDLVAGRSRVPRPATGTMAISMSIFCTGGGPHGHPNAAAAFGSHARLPRVGPALGTPPGRRDLSLTPRLGFSCPRLGVAAGALSESNTGDPERVAYNNLSFRHRRFAMVVLI